MTSDTEGFQRVVLSCIRGKSIVQYEYTVRGLSVAQRERKLLYRRMYEILLNQESLLEMLSDRHYREDTCLERYDTEGRQQSSRRCPKDHPMTANYQLQCYDSRIEWNLPPLESQKGYKWHEVERIVQQHRIFRECSFWLRHLPVRLETFGIVINPHDKDAEDYSDDRREVKEGKRLS